jgi:hypothetical protein
MKVIYPNEGGSKMFKRILFMVVVSLIFLLMTVTVMAGKRTVADEEAVIVDINGDGTPDGVLLAGDADIDMFLKIDGYSENMQPIINETGNDEISPCEQSQSNDN